MSSAELGVDMRLIAMVYYSQLRGIRIGTQERSRRAGSGRFCVLGEGSNEGPEFTLGVNRSIEINPKYKSLDPNYPF